MNYTCLQGGVLGYGKDSVHKRPGTPKFKRSWWCCQMRHKREFILQVALYTCHNETYSELICGVDQTSLETAWGQVHPQWAILSGPLESFFGRQRSAGGRNTNPTVKQFIDNIVSLRVQRSASLSQIRGNCRKRSLEKSTKVDNAPLPKRRRCKKWIGLITVITCICSNVNWHCVFL